MYNISIITYLSTFSFMSCCGLHVVQIDNCTIIMYLIILFLAKFNMNKNVF